MVVDVGIKLCVHQSTCVSIYINVCVFCIDVYIYENIWLKRLQGVIAMILYRTSYSQNIFSSPEKTAVYCLYIYFPCKYCIIQCAFLVIFHPIRLKFHSAKAFDQCVGECCLKVRFNTFSFRCSFYEPEHTFFCSVLEQFMMNSSEI